MFTVFGFTSICLTDLTKSTSYHRHTDTYWFPKYTELFTNLESQFTSWGQH